MNIASSPAQARRRAISLIEGVLYLAIALAVIVGGIVFFQQAQFSNQVTSVARTSVGLTSQVQGLYTHQDPVDVDTPITDAVIKSGVVPSNYLAQDEDGNDIIQHPFGGQIVLEVLATGQSMVELTLRDLPQDACTRLGQKSEDGAGPLGSGIHSIRFTGEYSVLTSRKVTAERAARECEESTDVSIRVPL